MWSLHVLLIGFAVIKIIIAGETPTVPPSWILRPYSEVFAVGSNAKVKCKADGFPKPQIVWKKSVGNAPGEYNEIKANDNIQVDEGTLYIDNIQKSDGGYYSCEAINGIGSDLRAGISIRVQSPPKFAEKSRNQTARRYEEVVLQCEASGDELRILWIMDVVPLDANSDKRYTFRDETLANGIISTLTINPAQRSDSALFSCLAENDFGRETASINLLVQEAPETPYGVKVLDRWPRMLRVGWGNPYDGNSPIKRYVIEFKTSNGSWEHNVNRVFVSGDTYYFRVEELSPGTAYDFRVAAENEVGVSELSEVASAVTVEVEPSGKPQDIKVESTSPTSLRVTWKAPPRSEWNGDLSGFHVRCKIFGCPSCSYYFEAVNFTKEEEQDKEYSLEIKDLKPYTQYTVTVQAYNIAGDGPSSDEINQYTVQGTPNDRPSMVTCTTIDSTRIRVGWSSLPFESANDIVKGYKLIYAPKELWNDEKEKIFIRTTATQQILHGLKINTNYTIQVLAVMSSGNDDVSSSPIFCQTEQDEILSKLMDQKSSKKQVSCDAKNQSQIANVDFECQEMILEDLDFEGLVNVSQISRHFSDLANELVRRKFASIDNVLIGPTNRYGEIDDAIAKWNISNGLLKLQPDFAADFLQGFGRFIKKLDIRFYYIEDHAKFGHLINTYCSDTLFELAEQGAEQSFLDAMQRPFKRVERVKIQTYYLIYKPTIKLNDLFPSVRYLILEQFWPNDPNKQFPIVYNYPNLMELQITAFVSHSFDNLFKLNPYLRRITCDYIESTEPLRTINDHYPELESLGFSVFGDYADHDGPVVNFKNVKDLFLKDSRLRPKEINPEKFYFEKLETLKYVRAWEWTTKIEDWFKVFRMHKNIKKLFIDVYVSSDDLLDLTKDLTYLEEASIINEKHEPIEQFQHKLGSEWNITYNEEHNRLNFTKLGTLKRDDAEIECTEKTKKGSKLLDLLEAANKSEDCLELASMSFFDYYRMKTFAIHNPVSSADPIVIDYESLDTVHIHDVETAVNLLKNFGRYITQLHVSYIDSNQYTEINELIEEHCSQTLTELHFVSFNGNLWSDMKKPFFNVRILSIGHTIQKPRNETMKLGKLFPHIKKLYLNSIESFDTTFVEQTFSYLVNLTIKFSPFNGTNYLTPADVGQFLKHNPQIRVLDSNNADVANHLDGINSLEKISLDESFLNASTLEHLTLASQNFTNLREISLLCGADVNGKDVADFLLKNKNLEKFTLKLYKNIIRKQFFVNLFDSYKEWDILDYGPLQYAHVSVSEQVHTTEMKRIATNSNVLNERIGEFSTEQIKFDKTPTTVATLLPETTESHATAQSGLKFKEFHEELDKVLCQLSFIDAMKLSMEIMQRANEFLETSKI